MSNESHVMTLLEEGNPALELGDDAPIDLDALTYLATLEQRSRKMTLSETKEIREDAPRRSNRPWLVAAVVVLVLGMAVVVFNQMNTTPVAGVPEIRLDGAEEHPGATEALSAVKAAYAAFNAGDPAWIELRSRGSYYGTAEEEATSREQEREEWMAVMAAGTHYEVSTCVSEGPGEWPTVVDFGVPAPSGYYFTCETARTDSLLEIAGVHSSGTYHWVVDDSGVVAVKDTGFTSEDVLFLPNFAAWLRSEHQEAATELAPLLDEPGYGFADPETKARMIEYAEEFVAQSNVYPLETPDS